MANLRGHQSAVTNLALATSANNATRNGATLDFTRVEPGTLICACYSDVTTAVVAATFTPQVSRDGTTWWDLRDEAGTAPVAFPAGTGASVVTRRALAIPYGGSGFRYFRCNAVLAGAATAAADKTQVDYDFVLFPNLVR